MKKMKMVICYAVVLTGFGCVAQKPVVVKQRTPWTPCKVQVSSSNIGRTQHYQFKKDAFCSDVSEQQGFLK